MANPTSFTFLWPSMLWLLLAVPLLMYAYSRVLKRRGAALARHARLETVGAATTGRLQRSLPPLLWLLGLTALLLAVARPQATLVLPARIETIILAVDMSGSMRATDLEPTPMAAAQNAAKAFVAEQPRHVKIGVVGIAASAAIVQSPTDKREDIVQAIEPTGASAVKWFPGSRRVAFISRVWRDLDAWDAQGRRLKERADSKMTARTWDKAPIRYWDHWLDDREAHLFTVGIEGGDPQPVTLGTGLQLSKAEPGPDSYDISPDGAEIAFAADTDTTGVAPNDDIHLIPAQGGPARNITKDNPADDSSPLYSPDGRVVAFGRQTIRDFYARKRRKRRRRC